MRIVKLICGKCFKEKFGYPPENQIYKVMSERPEECEECGKTERLYYITEAIKEIIYLKDFFKIK